MTIFEHEAPTFAVMVAKPEKLPIFVNVVVGLPWVKLSELAGVTDHVTVPSCGKLLILKNPEGQKFVGPLIE